MVTSRMLGAFRDDATTRRELLAMIGNRGATITE
jgi:GTP cyclohydrolase I